MATAAHRVPLWALTQALQSTKFCYWKMHLILLVEELHLVACGDKPEKAKVRMFYDIPSNLYALSLQKINLTDWSDSSDKIGKHYLEH